MDEKNELRRRIPRWRRFVYWLIIGLFAYAATELTASIALFVRFGHMPDMEEISQQANDGPSTQPGTSRYLPAAMIHPYFGYVHFPGTTPRTTMAVKRLSVAFSDEGGFIIKPGELSVKPQPAASQWGFLDTQSPLRHRSPDKLIVGIVGGSVAENFSVQGAQRLAEELAKIDRFAGKKIEFVRLAMQGFKQPQQLLAVTYLLSLGGEFDVLVNLDGFNEVCVSIFQNYERGVYPSFPMLWDLRVKTAGATADYVAMGRIAATRIRRDEWASFFVKYPWRSSSISRCIWFLVSNRFAKQQLKNWKQLQTAAKPQRSPATCGPYKKYPDDATLYQDCVEVWQRSSRQLHELCESHGIVYYHFLQPSQYVAKSKPMGKPEQQLAITPGSPFERVVQQGYPLLIAAGGQLETEGIRFHSLTDVFRDHEEPLYKDNCCHINDAGNQVIASEIARFIQQRP